MRRSRSRKRWIVLAALVLGGAVGVGVAVATVTATVLADTHSVRLRIVRSEFVPSADQPHFSSLWHTHPGPVIVQVQEGHFKITQNCETTKVGPGDTYIEVPELPVLAESKGPIKWTSTLILPDSPPNPTMTFVAEPSCPGRGGDDD